MSRFAPTYNIGVLLKNPAEDISDERTADAFITGLRRLEFIEEMGRIRPKNVSELMDIAIKLHMAKTLITIREHSHPRMIDLIVTITRSVGPVTMRAIVHTVK
jgi:hypothetical protein